MWWNQEVSLKLKQKFCEVLSLVRLFLWFEYLVYNKGVYLIYYWHWSDKYSHALLLIPFPIPSASDLQVLDTKSKPLHMTLTMFGSRTMLEVAVPSLFVAISPVTVRLILSVTDALSSVANKERDDSYTIIIRNWFCNNYVQTLVYLWLLR